MYVHAASLLDHSRNSKSWHDLTWWQGHDTTITYAGQWLDYFLSNTLNDTRFNGDGTPGSRTLVLLTFDESDRAYLFPARSR